MWVRELEEGEENNREVFASGLYVCVHVSGWVRMTYEIKSIVLQH